MHLRLAMTVTRKTQGRGTSMLIKMYTDVSHMTGTGEEWLLDSDGNVRAVFIDGQLRCEVFAIGDYERTKVAV
jgi:hypothetical protein